MAEHLTVSHAISTTRLLTYISSLVEHFMVSQSMSKIRLDIYVTNLVVLIAGDTIRCSTMAASDL
jgi:hypothetical protein